MVIEALKLVDLAGSDGSLTPGLVPVRGAIAGTLRIEEKAAVTYAEMFECIDYIFFRRFSDGRSSQIAAYVIDNSTGELDEKALAELHEKVWLHGAAPLLYVFWPTRIDILTCVRGPDFWDEKHGECRYAATRKFEIEALKTAGEIADDLRRFSVLRLADGTFWETPSNNYLVNYDETAHSQLIQAVVDADKALGGQKKPILRQLLLLMVLVKYLEDRGVFPDNFFSGFHEGATGFLGVLRGGDPQEVRHLLDFFKGKFNGDVFSLGSIEQEALDKDTLTYFAELVQGQTIKQQRYLWKQFSFKHLPVEIISSLYQRFVDGGHGKVYTPTFLAALLLDYAMPYEKLTGHERILDPACGSGIFLVGAFKRLVNVWRKENNWQRPDVDTLKRILKESIFGIEVDTNAIHLTAFSMSLAICDALQSHVIWEELKFDKLRESNLLEADFFRVLQDCREGKPTILQEGFDVVVGNPPFESDLSAAGEEINGNAQREDSKRGSLPDNQSAYLFLEQTFLILRASGTVCLIQPHGLLYNSYARKFQTTIFQKHKILTILDFVSIRKLYEGADAKTIAVLAQPVQPLDGHQITHQTFRRTVSVKEHICFELDHYDWHLVLQKQAMECPYVWRSNLLGGGRLFDISKRFLGMRSLGKYVKQQHWNYGNGFIVGNGSKPAPFLTGKDFLPAEALDERGIDENRIRRLTETGFERPRSQILFTPPLILIKKVDFLPTVYWDKRYLTYGYRIVGVHSPPSEASDLLKLCDALSLHHEFYKFSCALNGMSLLGTATAISKDDIDKLPYPDDLNELTLSFWEKALCEDTLTYITDYIRLGQNSDLLTKAVDANKLRTYSDMFIQMLKSVYNNLQASKPIFRFGLACQPFYFGEPPDLSWLSDEDDLGLQKLIYSEEKHSYLRTIRVLRFYSENYLLLIKPDRLRYWIRSTAIRDADETIVDLSRQGY